MRVVVMGASGCGKTTVGELLAARLGCGFADADVFHSAANKAKMHHGVALTDEDRWPWLRAIRAALDEHRGAGEDFVIACSALKESYRDVLRADDPEVRFLYLQGDYAVLRERLGTRTGHFFDPALLQSQLDTLEEPTSADALTLEIHLTPEQIVERTVAWLAR